MRPMRHAWSILIEVTNACRLRCAHCTAGVPHVARPHFMSTAQADEALRSLGPWPKAVGCFGGEPTLHPEFDEICRLFRRHVPRARAVLWTSGGAAYQRHREAIDRTFGMVAFNDHRSPGWHQPFLVAIDEVVASEDERRRLIDACWLQHHWSPVITARGAFFCEVAATLDTLFGGQGGHAVVPRWWERHDEVLVAQRERWCGRCGMSLPLEPQPDTACRDVVSPRNAERLLAAGSPLARRDGLDVVSTVDLRRRPSRDPRWFAEPGTPHFWTRLNLRAGFWMLLQYRHAPSGVPKALRDIVRFAALRRWAPRPPRSGRPSAGIEA